MRLLARIYPLTRRVGALALVLSALPGVPQAQPVTIPVAYGPSCFDPSASAMHFCVQNTQSVPVIVGYVVTDSPSPMVVPINLNAFGGAQPAGGPTGVPGQNPSLFVVTTTTSGDFVSALPVAFQAVYRVETDAEGRLTLRLIPGAPGVPPAAKN